MFCCAPGTNTPVLRVLRAEVSSQVERPTPCLMYRLGCARRYANPLGCAHDSDHLSKFEELVEAAVDLVGVRCEIDRGVTITQ
jgi:hypothetical protein